MAGLIQPVRYQAIGDDDLLEHQCIILHKLRQVRVIEASEARVGSGTENDGDGV